MLGTFVRVSRNEGMWKKVLHVDVVCVDRADRVLQQGFQLYIVG